MVNIFKAATKPLSGISDFLFGGGDQLKQIPTMDPQQQNLLQQLIQQLTGGQLGQAQGQGISQLQQMMDPSSSAFQQFAQPQMEQFQQQTVPGLAERFAGAGAQSGALSSSGFGQALGAAGAGLQTGLAAQKGQMQQNAIQQILQQFGQQSGQALGQRPFGTQQIQGGQGQIGNILGALTQFLPLLI